jgi:hypothetical protein
MNERIDELLWQAGGYTKLNYPNDTFLDGRYALTQLQLDKFAELIVKECVSICYAESRTAGANGNLAEYSALSKAGGHIKEHFGVEE